MDNLGSEFHFWISVFSEQKINDAKLSNELQATGDLILVCIFAEIISGE